MKRSHRKKNPGKVSLSTESFYRKMAREQSDKRYMKPRERRIFEKNLYEKYIEGYRSMRRHVRNTKITFPSIALSASSIRTQDEV